MFDLTTYHSCESVVIQCHDNPDADAIGSGFALYQYFKDHNVNARLVYSGRSQIAKVNLVRMVEFLHVPIEYVDSSFEAPDLLITVDCQYGSSNVTQIKSNRVVVVDHHIPDPNRAKNEFEYIKSGYGSCATVVYHLLLQQNYSISSDVATALYYGLYMDTGELSEISTMADKDARDELHFNQAIFNKLQNSNLTLNEFSLAGKALANYEYYPERRMAIIKTEPCDVNILGFISDLLLIVDGVDVGIVYADLGDITKISIRSCISEVKANELAQSITNEIGGGGGHLRKSGGYINNLIYNAQKAQEYESMSAYIYSKFCSFYDSFDYIYTENFELSLREFELYSKNPVVLGCVCSLDIALPDQEIMIRTREGDVVERASDNLYIMIGIFGEVYPIKRENFLSKYKMLDTLAIIPEQDYSPRVRIVESDQIVFLKDFMRPCQVIPNRIVYAKQLIRDTKIFSDWNYANYMYGNIGDYVVCYQNEDGTPCCNDMYIVKREIFSVLYQKV